MWLLILSFGAYLFGLWNRYLLYAGFLFQVSYMASRSLELGRLPLVGAHDTVTFLSLSVVTFSIPFQILLKGNSRFHTGTVILALSLTAFSLLSRPYNMPLPPVLRTFWFEIHVVMAFLSYALFAISAILGYVYLKEGDGLFDGMQYRAVLIGYCLFTLSIIFGGIWAYLAWGTYWLWTPKELWTSILWLFYGFYLHARLRQWWAGRPMAVLSITGFAIVMFTYLGVSLLMKSSHSF
jgi:ABC-type transport system involved in cytochrome c biogenesis permease subunit